MVANPVKDQVKHLVIWNQFNHFNASAEVDNAPTADVLVGILKDSTEVRSIQIFAWDGQDWSKTLVWNWTALKAYRQGKKEN